MQIWWRENNGLSLEHTSMMMGRQGGTSQGSKKDQQGRRKTRCTKAGDIRVTLLLSVK
jgi:hypothetical protein